MTDAHRWLDDDSPASNPKVVPDSSECHDPNFEKLSRGTSITVAFDSSTKPSRLSWLGATDAKQWSVVLRCVTGLGSIVPNENIEVAIEVIDTDKVSTVETGKLVSYFWPHQIVSKAKSLRETQQFLEAHVKAKGPTAPIPLNKKNIECFHDLVKPDEVWTYFSLDDEEKKLVDSLKPTIYFAYMYSAKIWRIYNEKLGIRAGNHHPDAGIQLAANNMPQGVPLQIDLRRNAGRQNQVHILVHYENAKSDLGRKGFQKDAVDLAQRIAKQLVDRKVGPLRSLLRPVTGEKDDLDREQSVANWKTEFAEHEKTHPLLLIDDRFFSPTNKLPITSTPTREQDVIALFNQLIAGGVIRGIAVMSTNERFVYDSMFRVIFGGKKEHHIFHAESNPLGVSEERYKIDFRSEPRILEYKFSLDGLIEDIENGDKNSNDINLVVVWDIGEDFRKSYLISSLLDPDNLAERQFHGVTHVATNLVSTQREFDIICLRDLVNFLKDANSTIAEQRVTYSGEE